MPIGWGPTLSKIEEGFHQMPSCFVTHAASVPNSRFSGAEHSWFVDEFFSTFLLAQRSQRSVQLKCLSSLWFLILFVVFTSCRCHSENSHYTVLAGTSCLLSVADTASIKTRCVAQDARRLLGCTWNLLQHYCFKHRVRSLETTPSSSNSSNYIAVQSFCSVLLNTTVVWFLELLPGFNSILFSVLIMNEWMNVVFKNLMPKMFPWNRHLSQICCYSDNTEMLGFLYSFTFSTSTAMLMTSDSTSSSTPLLPHFIALWPTAWQK